MKKFKLIALVLAVVMLSACFVACEKTEKVTVNVTVSVLANDEILVAPIAVPVEAPVDDPATILDCVIHAFELNDVEFVADEMSVTSIKGLADKVEGDRTYWWDFTINGAVPETGRAGTIAAKDGDVIVFTYFNELTEALIAAEGDK